MFHLSQEAGLQGFNSQRGRLRESCLTAAVDQAREHRKQPPDADAGFPVLLESFDFGRSRGSHAGRCAQLQRTRSALSGRSRRNASIESRTGGRVTPSAPRTRVRGPRSRGAESPGHPERAHRAATHPTNEWSRSPAVSEWTGFSADTIGRPRRQLAGPGTLRDQASSWFLMRRAHEIGALSTASGARVSLLPEGAEVAAPASRAQGPIALERHLRMARCLGGRRHFAMRRNP
jgi:hypothetical protein